MKRLALLLGIAVLSGCSTQSIDPVQAPNKVQSNEAFRVGLLMKEKHALFNRGFTFKLSDDTVFQPLISMVNDTPETSTFAFIFLLDYKQISVMHASGRQKIVSSSVAPHSSFEFQVEMSDIPAGRHDFLLIAVRNPEQHLLEDKVISPLQTYFYRRATLLVGSDNMPEPTFEEVNADEAQSPVRASVFLTRPASQRPEDMLKMIRYDADSRFQLHFMSKPSIEHYAVTALVNNDQSGLPVLFLKKTQADQEGLISLPLDIKVPPVPTPQELTLIVVENPFERVDDVFGDYTGMPWNVSFSNKMTIQ